ncbi:MAG: hypothetical protein RIQ81_51 [Pseudomonadota bacterium]|jgi:hypothetical protein
MVKKKQNLPTWRNCKTVAEACHLVDVGILLSWKDGRQMTTILNGQEQADVVKHMIVRLCERGDIRLSQEIIVESLLIWLANAQSESMIVTVLEELFANPQAARACENILQVVFSAEYADKNHAIEIYNLSVVLVCELGFAIRAFDQQFPGELRNARQLLDRVATYLLSASNSSSDAVRFSLIHYFGETEQGIPDKPFFNRVMSRFGHTVLDQLFSLLFKKKVESVALQFLLENMPFILEADHHTQVMVHESMKFYALKHPDRFGLFLNALANRVAALPAGEYKMARRALLMQYSALYRVLSEVNARELGRDVAVGMCTLRQDDSFQGIIQELSRDRTLRLQFHEMLQKIVQSAQANVNPADVVVLKSVKRGRKPTLAKAGELGTVTQVSFLAQAAG